MRIIIFGDSISEGYSDYEFGGWGNRLKTEYMKKYSCEKMVMNYGISGYTSENLVNFFDSFFQAVSRQEPGKEKESIVIFAIGINDSSESINGEKRVDLTHFEKNIKILIEKCQKEKLIQKVLFIGNINVNEAVVNDTTNEGNEYFFYNSEIKKYNNILKEITNNSTYSYLELFGSMKPEDLEDGLHPNSKGHKKVYEIVEKYMEDFS